MALIVQDGTGAVADANGYISVAYFKSYHADRGNDKATEYNDDEIAAAIIRASDYIDGRWTLNTSLLYGLTPSAIPTRFKNAVAEYALRSAILHEDESSLSPDVTRDMLIESSTKKIGPIEKTVKYASSSFRSISAYPAADMMIAPYTSRIGTFRVYRG
jgi:hypothetical protein